MRYFVTGATGFIGGHLARQLVEAGHQVVALVRSPARAQALRALGVTLATGDTGDRASLRRAMAGADGVFHTAGWYEIGVAGTRPAYTTNVAGTANVLETMGELGIAKGVYTSSLAVFSDTRGRLVDETYRFSGRHINIYDRTKWLAHYDVAEPLQKAGLPLVIVMPGLTYGPGDHSSVRLALLQYLQRKLPLMPRGTAYCWAHVEDTARGHIQAMERGRPGQSYIIAGPPCSFVEAMRLAERLCGVPPPRLTAGPALLKAMAALADLAGGLVPLPQLFTAESLRTSAGVTYLGDNAKARRELGFNPRPLAEGLREVLRHEMSLLGMPLPATLRESSPERT